MGGLARGAPTLGADDSLSDGFLKTKGIPHGKDHLPHLHFVGITEFDGHESLGRHLQNGYVGALVRPGDHGRKASPVVELNGDLCGAVDHVAVGDDVAVLGDDQAASHLAVLRDSATGDPEELAEKRIPVGSRHRGDAHHRGDHVVDEIGELVIELFQGTLGAERSLFLGNPQAGARSDRQDGLGGRGPH